MSMATHSKGVRMIGKECRGALFIVVGADR